MAKTNVQPIRVVTRQQDVAYFFNRKIDAVKNWAKQGMPGEPGAYDLVEIARWLFTVGPWKPDIPDDPLLEGGGDSPALERYRLARAELVEYELAEKRRNMLSREVVRVTLGRWAAILRQCGERLGKRFGSEAVETFNDSLAECESLVNREFGDADGSESGLRC